MSNLIRPVITEKTTKLTHENRFVFLVNPDANKTQVRNDVQKAFGVKVLSVQTITVPGKAYRTGKRWIYRQKSNTKKAIVTLQKGQRIDLFDVK